MKTRPLRLLVCVCLMIASAAVARAQDRHPVARVQAPPVYPYEMSKAGIGGRVAISFVINQEGLPVDVRVLQATHREFEMPAVQAVLKWRFAPGMKDGKPMASRVTQVLEFALGALPVYPREPLLKGQAGRAIVEIVVDAQGQAYAVQGVQASSPEFGGAAVAAAMASTYAPEFADKPTKKSIQRREYRFLPDGKGDAQVSEATMKAFAQLKKRAKLVPFSALDEPPKLKVHPEPRVATDVLAAASPGHARVTVIVDQDGNVLFPQVVSATHEVLGYAAVQAVADWKYEAPRKGRKKVLAEGIIEVSFGAK